DGQPCRVSAAELRYLPHDLVSRRDLRPPHLQLASDHLQIGAPDAAGAHPHQHLARSRYRTLHLGQLKRMLAPRCRMWQNPGLHTNNASIDASFARVVGIMHRLRAPEGCPWDRAQTFESIRAHTLEETYEVLEAISARDFAALREELGDLLLHVLFYSEMAAEQDRFTIADVLNELADKLVRRHPHVFQPGESAASPEAALGRWNAMKAAEKGGSPRKSLLDGIPRELPGLAEAAKLGHRAASVGFDWPDPGGVAAKVEEEWGELHAEMAANAPSKPRM